MINMLLELTTGSFYYGMEDFQSIIANSKDVLKAIDISDCIEFGTRNGQELLIYDLIDGRKHIKYSCMITHMYDRVVIQNAYSAAGLEFEYNFDSTLMELKQEERGQ